MYKRNRLIFVTGLNRCCNRSKLSLTNFPNNLPSILNRVRDLKHPWNHHNKCFKKRHYKQNKKKALLKKINFKSGKLSNQPHFPIIQISPPSSQKKKWSYLCHYAINRVKNFTTDRIVWARKNLRYLWKKKKSYNRELFRSAF